MKKNTPIALLATALFLLGGVPSAMAATNDYTNYWSFDDATGLVVADSVGGKNGTIVGTSTGLGWAGGKSGTALAMDGVAGEAVNLPNAALAPSTQGSISVWFKMDAYAYGNMLFVTRTLPNNNVYTALSIDSDGRPQLQFRTTPTGADRKVQGAKILNINEWYNLVLTADALTYHMYVNGEEIAVAGENIGRWFSDFTVNTLMYRIGSLDVPPHTGVFKGILDEVKIYNRVLNLAEVGALYEEGNIGTPTLPLSVRPSLSFTISNDHVAYGGSVTVNWSSTNVTSCTAGGNWDGDVGTAGSRIFAQLGSDATYTLHCVGTYGSIDATVRVFVAPQNATTSAPMTGTTGSLSAVSIFPPLPPTASPKATLALTRNLFVGVRGDDVKSLQLHLIAKGYLAEGLSTGYFGMLTKAAAIKLQAALMLPQTGFVGPMTRAKLIAE